MPRSRENGLKCSTPPLRTQKLVVCPLNAILTPLQTQLADRINEGADEYRSMLDSAQSVQEQVETLTTQVQQLADALHEPEVSSPLAVSYSYLST
jgi:DNA anti-recombination protein RmuC